MSNKKWLFIIPFLISLGVFFVLGYNIALYKNHNIGPYLLPKEAIVVKVIDGDTVEVTSPDKIGQGMDRVSSRSVRYLGINAPDAGEEHYQDAKRVNERLVLGKKVTLEYDVPQNDKYGRILAWIWFEGKLINKEMVASGFSKPFTMEGQRLKYEIGE